jgi:hypothetical protein
VVRSSVDPDGAQLAIPVERLPLEISISPSHIQGWGLQVADIAVNSMSSSPAARGANVQLSTNLGLVEPLNVTLDDNGTARATIRSVSSGAATVSAEGRCSAPRPRPASTSRGRGASSPPRSWAGWPVQEPLRRQAFHDLQVRMNLAG